MPKPAKIPAAITATPYVFPRFNAAIAADFVDEVEAVAVASPKEPKPVVVAAVAEPEAPEVEVAVLEDVLATVGF